MPKEIFHPVSRRRPRGKNPPLPRPINRGPHPAAGPDFAIGTALLMTVLRVATGLASEDEPSDNPSVLTANETLARAGFPAIPENARELECYAWTGLGTGISATFLLKRPALAPFPASFPGLDEPPQSPQAPCSAAPGRTVVHPGKHRERHRPFPRPDRECRAGNIPAPRRCQKLPRVPVFHLEPQADAPLSRADAVCVCRPRRSGSTVVPQRRKPPTAKPLRPGIARRPCAWRGSDPRHS